MALSPDSVNATPDQNTVQQDSSATPTAPAAAAAPANPNVADQTGQQGTTILSRPPVPPAIRGGYDDFNSPARPNPTLTAPVDNGSFSSRLSNAMAKSAPALGTGVPGVWQRFILGTTTQALINPTTPAGQQPPAPKQGQGQPRQAGWDSIDAENAAQHPVIPNAAPKVSGADLAIGVMNGAMKNFGDFASGVGAKGGIAGALLHGFQSHGKRLEEELKDHQQIATANAQLLHETALTHSLGQEQILKGIDFSKQGMAALTNPALKYPGVKVAEGLTSGELANEVNQGHVQPWQDSVFLSGQRQVGTNPDGTPQYKSTYSAIRIPMGEIAPAQADLDKINEQLGTNYKQDDNNSFKMKMSQFNQLWQDTTADESYKAAAKLAAEKAGLDAEKTEAAVHESALRNDSLVRQAVSQAAAAGSSHPFVTAYQNLLNNKMYETFRVSHPDFATEFPLSFGDNGKTFETWQKDAAAEVTKKQTEADKRWTKYDAPGVFAGEKGAAAVGELTTMLNDNENPLSPEDKKKATSYLKQAQASVIQTQNFEAQKLKAAQAAKDGDPSSAGYMLYHNLTSPEELRARSNPEYLRLAVAEANKLAQADGTVYNAAIADGYAKAAQSTPLVAQFGNANSLLDKGGTIDQVIVQHKDLKPGTFPIFNKYADLIAYAAGNPELAAYQTAVIGMADDFSKVMGAGAGSDHARDQMIKAFTYQMNQGQLEGAANAAKNAVTSQVRSKIGTNPFLMQMYGYNLPEYQRADQQRKTAATSGTNGGHPVNSGAPNVGGKSTDLVRPAQYPSAVATQDFKGKDGVVRTYWVDTAHKPLGLANVPQE